MSMEEDTQANSNVQLMESDSTNSGNFDPVQVEAVAEEILTNGVLQLEKKEETKQHEEEISLEGEFIKIEKETLDLKDSAHTAEKAVGEQEEKPSVMESSGISVESRDILEAQENKKELELELETLARVLKHSEAEIAGLKEEILVIKAKLEESNRHCEELKHNQLIETEKYNEQLSTLQEALQAQNTENKELINVKEAFDGLTIELGNSRKKVQELEHELQSLAGDARKFEELNEQNSLHVASEMQRALEFERLLELAKVSAKEMEDQMLSLQEEMNGLNKKISGNEQVEETLQNTKEELSAVRGELEHSKSREIDLQQKLTSVEAVISELTKEVDLHKASESQMKEDILALENLFSSTKDDLVAKVAELEVVKVQLQKEVEMRVVVEARSKNQEEHISTVQEEMTQVAGEKLTLEAVMEDLNVTIMQMKESCGDLEKKLKLSDENFQKSDSLLSQALLNNTELEQKLKSLEELHRESGSIAATAAQKNIELEGAVGASNAAAEEMKSLLRDMESKLISTEQKNVELEQLLNLVELKSNEAEREVKEFSEKVSELNDMLRGSENEKIQVQNRSLEYKEKIIHLEDSLGQASLRNSELEQELKYTADKCAEHEGRANTTHERSLQLEDLMQISHSKIEDASRKVGELEILMEAANNRNTELEEQISALETKVLNKEEESNKFSEKVLDLMGQLEDFQGKATSLEVMLQGANEKEMELKECLNLVTEEKERLEKASSDSLRKLSETENKLEILRSELNSALEKLESIEQDLKVSGIRESEIIEKLKSAEEKLKQQEILIEQTDVRNSELESLHTSLAKDSELKMQEIVIKFANKESEAKSLYEKLEIFEEQMKIYEEKCAEADEKSASLKAELEESLTKIVALESNIIKLQGKVSEAEASQSFLTDTNSQLRNKVNELQEMLIVVSSEKKATFEQLALHMNTIAELTDHHSKASVLQSETEFRIREAEIQLQEAIERYTLRDMDAKELNEKLNAFESQLKGHEEAASEASRVAETRKVELEEALFKVNKLETVVQELHGKSAQSDKECEALAEANMKLTQELVEYESKLNELQNALSTALIEKDSAVEQLQASRKMVEDLTQKLAADEQKLQSKITSVMEENNTLKITFEDARKEFEATINQLQTQIDERITTNDNLKAEMDSFKAMLVEKSALQERVLELEQQLLLVENRLNDEVESTKAVAAQKEAELVLKLEELADKVKDRDIITETVLQLQKDLSLAHATISEQEVAYSKRRIEIETTLTNSLQELETKHQQLILLEKRVEELEQNLHISNAKSMEKDEELKKLSLICTEVGDLRTRSSHISELKKKIEELENKLKQNNLNSFDQGSISSQIDLKEGTELKSRDLGSIALSTPSKKKSKKKSEATSVQSSTTSEIHAAQATEVPAAMNFKFILGIALVSVICGIILGKQY